MRTVRFALTLALLGALSCRGGAGNVREVSAGGRRSIESPASPGPSAVPSRPRLPLVLVADVDLPGRATRFDYQDVDRKRGDLVIAHMNDASVLFVDLGSGRVLKELTGIPVARGVAVAEDARLVFVTSSPGALVVIDGDALEEIRRVKTGKAPDGVAWDGTHAIVGVSDQGDGALSLIADSGRGPRRQFPLGSETGNVVFDAGRGWFWITVVGPSAPDRLVAVDPVSGNTAARLPLPGCRGAHGLRLHPDGKSAFVACESNAVLARVALDGASAAVTAPTGEDPDVLALDPSIGWLYVAAESGELTVFDLARPGIQTIGHAQPGPDAHSVAVDSATHRVFFPLEAGPRGTPVLRIMKPTGA